MVTAGAGAFARAVGEQPERVAAVEVVRVDGHVAGIGAVAGPARQRSQRPMRRL